MVKNFFFQEKEKTEVCLPDKKTEVCLPDNKTEVCLPGWQEDWIVWKDLKAAQHTSHCQQL